MIKKEKRGKSEYTPFQAGSYFRGLLDFTEPAIIHGRFDGDITGKSHIILSESAQIEGNIEAEEITVLGKITGNLTGRSRVELKNGAQVYGNIRSPKFEVEDGVVFDGQCEMKQAEPALKKQ